MITLTKRLRQESEGSKPTKSKKEETSRVSVRDKLLVKEVINKNRKSIYPSSNDMDLVKIKWMKSWLASSITKKYLFSICFFQVANHS